MPYLQSTGEGYLAHDALDHRRLTLTVLAHESHLLAPLDGKGGIGKDQVVAIALAHPLGNDGIVARAGSRGKFQIQVRRVYLVDLDPFEFGQLLDARLHLHRLGCLVAETLDKGLGVLYLFLLVLIGPALLFETLLPQNDVVRIVDLIVVDVSHRNLDGASRHIVDKGAVVRNQHHGIGTRGQKIFEPLYRLDVEVVGRLVEQQHVGALQQQLGQLDAHAPAPAELRGIAIEIVARETQANQGLLDFGLIVGRSDERELLVGVGDPLDKLLVVVRLVVGSFGQFGVHTLDARLQFKNVGKSLLGLLHHGAGVGQVHLLRQIPHGKVFRHVHPARGRRLQPGYDFQHGRFARPILPDQGDAITLVDDISDVIEQRISTKSDRKSFYRYHISRFISRQRYEKMSGE